MTSRYRRSGATLPYGDLLGAHGVAMEGYFWRFTDPVNQRALIALCGIQDGWALVGYGATNDFLRTRVLDGATASAHGAAVRTDAMTADATRVRVDLGDDARLDVTIEDAVTWPRRRFGGSSWFQSVPALNQYWHPWLLGGRASGTAVVGGETWQLDRAQVYGEKNWGRGGFPDSWWWGQAQGFDEPDACVAFAGGEVTAGPLRTTVTAVVVRLPYGHVLRLGNPVTSPVQAVVGDDTWHLRGAGGGWTVEVDGAAPVRRSHVLPVPLVGERRAIPGALEHLAGTMLVRVRRWGRLVWEGRSTLAGLEHGGLDRAAAEMTRRGLGGQGREGAAPVRTEA